MRLDNHSSFMQCRRGTGGVTRREFVALLPTSMGVAIWGLRAPPFANRQALCRSRRSSNPLVYVVDDTAELTLVYRQLLEEAGYEVRTFNDREEALRVFLAEKRRPSLLITDYVGYPISAERLMEECRRAEPGLKILMATGCPEGVLCNVGVKPDRFLQKPFGIGKFVAEVRALTGLPASR